MTIGLHMGTHVDAPAHFIPGGDTFEKVMWCHSSRLICLSRASSNPPHLPWSLQIPLDVFIGHAYAVYVPAGSGNITDQVLAELQIPHDVERLLIRTSNSDE
jgi:kynurenine formamidase